MTLPSGTAQLQLCLQEGEAKSTTVDCVMSASRVPCCCLIDLHCHILPSRLALGPKLIVKVLSSVSQPVVLCFNYL